MASIFYHNEAIHQRTVCIHACGFTTYMQLGEKTQRISYAKHALLTKLVSYEYSKHKLYNHASLYMDEIISKKNLNIAIGTPMQTTYLAACCLAGWL